VNRSWPSGPWRLAIVLSALTGMPATRADPLSAVQTLREGGCGGVVPAARPLWHNGALDRIAELWAAGGALSAQAERSGYAPDAVAGVHARGPDSSLLELLRRSDCGLLSNQGMREIGVYRRAADVWLVLASARAPAPAAPTHGSSWPAPARPTVSPAPPAPVAAARALQLVNEVRIRGTRCGARAFAPAPPLRLSGTLASVALGHATDMAEHNYFEHRDLAGRSPADRVRAVGYRENLVGENIAYGPGTLDDAVRGWLDSPDHCENIMDPRFAEMGIANAAGHATARHGLYWVQLLAAPRA
jgi:uncharacterized protein YkwD